MLIPRQVFEAAKLAAKDQGRPVLQCVKFDRTREGKPRAVATDSKSMIIVEWAELAPEEFPANVGSTEHVPGFEALVPHGICKEAQKLVPSKSYIVATQNVLLEEESRKLGDGVADKVRLAGTDLETVRRLEPKKPEGNFPDWRHAIVKAPDGSIRFTVSGERLSEMLDVLRSVVGERNDDEVVITVPPQLGVPIYVQAKAKNGDVLALGLVATLKQSPDEIAKAVETLLTPADLAEIKAAEEAARKKGAAEDAAREKLNAERRNA